MILKAINKSLLTLALSASATFAFGQQHGNWCGTGDAPQANLEYIEQLRANGVFDNLDIEQVQNTIFVPLKIHIIGTNDGQGYHRLDDLMRNICQLNQQYKPTNIQFFLRGDINYINNSNLVNLGNNQGPVAAMQAAAAVNTQYNVIRVVNVYYTNLSGASLCGFANFPTTGAPNEPLRQGAIYLSPNCSGNNNTTFAHEMGHFLNLPHPFQDTSNDPSGPLSERVTRNPNEQAPRFAANCATAGDRFCDTPADFRGARWNCPQPNSTVTDINGDLFNPQSDLYMSYSNDPCQNRFSGENIAAMRATLTLTQNQQGQNVVGPRMYLLIPPMEPYDTITSTPTVLEPANNATGIPANWAFFRWNSVPGATKYVLRITRQNVILVDEVFLDRPDTTYLYRGSKLNPGTQYNVRIMPLNHKVTCSPFGQTINFTAGQGYGVSVYEQQKDFLQIYPSLLNTYEPIRVQAKDMLQHQVNYEVMDIQGRSILKNSLNTQGDDRFEIDLNNLPNGTYMIRIMHGNTPYFERVVISR
ncbi:MAG: M43 family zinc metalloprotease [Bacteroidia bacterium]